MFQAHGVNFVRASHTSLAQNAQQVSRDDFRAKYLIIAVWIDVDTTYGEWRLDFSYLMRQF